ncbi:hypothetical protein ACH41H_28055 [Streptomyces sp. NPDC020800]|uniref:hypothetical protein n=1 Tax=Streptomyces sp. NPDC020800 TaxID=3365092 RepID=UPI0037A356E5
MKKRSMLALASLATGFVVAAVTPSHSADHAQPGDLKAAGALDNADHAARHDGPAHHDDAPGQE